MAEVLIIGRGAREHALVKQFAQSPTVTRVFVAPGNAGMVGPKLTLLPLAETAFADLIAFAKTHPGLLTFVGGEAPLEAGIVDAFQQADLAIFGPTQAAARLETSKAFAKQMMAEADIPTARYQTFTTVTSAIDYAKTQRYPLVIKADGLAAGKGVVIAADLATAQSTLEDLLADRRFGTTRVVIEDYLEGQEFSSMAMIDGDRVVMLPLAQDHKAAYDDDLGPNTGGMGAYSPLPQLPQALDDVVQTRVIKPLLAALAARGLHFTGVLYVGMIQTAMGLRVIEFNVRFGDPEASVLLPRLAGDFYQLVQGLLGNGPLVLPRIQDEAVVGVVVSAATYPEGSGSGSDLRTFQALPAGFEVDFAGVKSAPAGLVSAGGRVLCLKTAAKTVEAAQARLYDWLDAQDLAGLRYRHDIGHRALR